MTALEARARLQRLAGRRLAVVEAGTAGTAEALADLSADIASCQVEFIALAVTEIASFRAELSGPQKG